MSSIPPWAPCSKRREVDSRRAAGRADRPGTRTAIRPDLRARPPEGGGGDRCAAGPRPWARAGRIGSGPRDRCRAAQVIVDVVIAIPAYNEVTTVAGVVTAARVHGPVLVVDDGSTDDTALRATEAGAVVIRHPVRRGKGAALATAFAAARARGAASVM